MSGYEGDAGRAFAEEYERLAPERIFAPVADLLPAPPASILDIGSGSGRDATWFAARGHAVFAVDPSPTMGEEARRRHADTDVNWLTDSLPSLEKVYRRNTSFDAIFASAVWMHIQPSDRPRAFRKMVGLLKPNGRLFVSLRLGPADASRHMFAVSVDEIERLAQKHAMSVVRQERSADWLGRKDVSWVTLVLRLLDDGTGALPLLRHVILNDQKSSTYKLALLRTVARIADGAQGMARHVSDNEVRVPLGLVALNWLRLYHPLLRADLPQSPTNRGVEGLGFIGDDWPTVAQLAATDLRVGMQFADERAVAVHGSIRKAANNIARMPAHHTTYPGSSAPVFPVYKARAGGISRRLTIDEEYLRSFGEFSIPVHLWRALTRFDVWIEPALVSEWTRLMENYARTQERTLDVVEMVSAMHWHDLNRDVSLVRNRVRELMLSRQVYCVWTGRRLRDDRFDIDHCLPWVVWPCGDLWNLLPSRRSVNQGKRDHLPSAEMMERSCERIMDWWDVAWSGNPATAARFTTEAKASLPIDVDFPGLEEVFGGLQQRRFAIRADHLVTEWSL